MAPSMSFDHSKDDFGRALDHIAPELFYEDINTSKEADMYALGVVVYKVITGSPLFARAHSLGSEYLRPEDPVAAGFIQGTWEFTEGCWERNTGQRPSAREALKHFERIAKISADVDPGPTITAYETRSYHSSNDSAENSVSVTSRSVGVPVRYGRKFCLLFCNRLVRCERIS